MRKIELKKVVSIILSLSLVLTTGINTMVETEASDDIKKEYIVASKTKSTMNYLSKRYESLDNKYTKKSNEVNICLNNMTKEDALNLRSEQNIISVEENIRLQGSGKNKIDPDEILGNWNLKMINATETITKKNAVARKIKVAIIDSGVDECNGIDVKVRFNLVPSEQDVIPIYDDITGHGTAIAGIIAGKKVKDRNCQGINQNVELYSIKVMESDNTASLSRVVEAIYKAIEYDVDIINMSFGTTVNSKILHQAIRKAKKAGILIIAAAGNRGNIDGRVEYPAAYEEVMAVGSVDSNGEISDDSSFEEKIDVLAPGELIKTTTNFGLETVFSGTSMAAPHVVGIASVLWQKDESKSADFIRGLIESTGKEICKNGNKYKVVDLKYALSKYDEYEKNYLNKSYVVKKNIGKIEKVNEMEKVTARWNTSDHVTLINNNKNGKLTEEQLRWIKAGIRYNDAVLKAKVDGIEHAIWHASQYDNGDRSNYLCATHLIGKVIQQTNCDTGKIVRANYQKANDNDIKDFRMKSGQVTRMLNDINAITLKKAQDTGALISSDNSLTDKRKRLLLFGMSLHLITDAFAHCAYKVQDYLPGNDWNQYEHIDSTDNTSVVPSRYKAAGVVVKNAMNQCLVFKDGNLMLVDSYAIRSKQLFDNNQYFDYSFRLFGLYLYGKANKSNDATFDTYQKQLVSFTYVTPELKTIFEEAL